jgi:hypothetical protein
MESSLGLAIQAIYKNADDINYNTFQAAQNKQYTTYGLVGVRKSIISKLKSVCAENQISISNITFFANSAADAAFVLNPKLKNDSFVLLDIKERSSRYSIVVKGRTVGYYSLPFGYSILSKTRMVSEDLLFDHSPAELLVLNAKEKASAKQLTVGEEVAAIESEETTESREQAETDNAFEMSDEASFETRYSFSYAKKEARKLPKFMQRENPSSREGYAYENFRIFMKWTLDLISNNELLVNLGGIDTVFVNMPADNDFLYEMVNREQDEQKVKFLPLLDSQDQEVVVRNLELVGGFYVKQYNKINNF